MLQIKDDLKEMRSLLDELVTVKKNYSTVFQELKLLDLKYQQGQADYKEYERLKNRILGKKTSEEILTSYNSYTLSIIKKLKSLNLKILNLAYNDSSFENLSIGKLKQGKKTFLPSLESLYISELEAIPVKKIGKKHEPLKESIKLKKFPEPPKPIEEIIVPPTPAGLEALPLPAPKKLSFWKRLIYSFQAKQKPWVDSQEQSKISFGGIFSIDFLRYLFTGEEKREDVFGETKVLRSILSFEEKKEIDRDISISKTDILDPYILEKEIKELKSLISKKKPEIYRASTLGYLSNITVRKISIFFIERYPEFFKNIYKAIRYSDIKILANTYINIMFFLTIIFGLFSVPVFTVFFAFQENSLLIIILKTMLAGISVSGLTFLISYYYPFMKSKSRRRSIDTNLPFAIDHMSSVIASGVNPSTMFKLISHSREYGEVSVEIEKVTNYIDFFGYDILTALKAVSLITPSEEFKEFLDGFVSTIETGGDLKDYLSQKSQEALLNYRLERQKYVESISTYSDIYTGVLIAAPLFFVTALSLVSVLGGTIGGLSVNTIITLGTYLIIPGLNLLFLIFLEMNQPEI